ncbi:MAG: hypothetical protein AAGD04_06450 [Pseudomonadota bacterium]
MAFRKQLTLLGKAACTGVLFLSLWGSHALAACSGTQISGPWFSALIPVGMIVKGLSGNETKRDSIWVEAQSGGASASFFLFAPRQGGRPYLAFANAKNVIDLIKAPNDLGDDLAFIVEYQDGATGYFEGSSQKVTGFKIYNTPLGTQDLETYRCFLDSVEQFAN